MDNITPGDYCNNLSYKNDKYFCGEIRDAGPQGCVIGRTTSKPNPHPSRHKNTLFIPKYPLPVHPNFRTKMNFNSAWFLAYLALCMQNQVKNDTHYFDEKFWVYGTYNDFAERMGISAEAFNRILRLCISNGLIEIKHYEAQGVHHLTNWYTLTPSAINYFSQLKSALKKDRIKRLKKSQPTNRTLRLLIYIQDIYININQYLLKTTMQSHFFLPWLILLKSYTEPIMKILELCTKNETSRKQKVDWTETAARYGNYDWKSIESTLITIWTINKSEEDRRSEVTYLLHAQFHFAHITKAENFDDAFMNFQKMYKTTGFDTPHGYIPNRPIESSTSKDSNENVNWATFDADVNHFLEYPSLMSPNWVIDKLITISKEKWLKLGAPGSVAEFYEILDSQTKRMEVYNYVQIPSNEKSPS